MFENDNRIKGTVSVPRHLNLYGVIVFGYNSFCCVTVSTTHRNFCNFLYIHDYPLNTGEVLVCNKRLAYFQDLITAVLLRRNLLLHYPVSGLYIFENRQCTLQRFACLHSVLGQFRFC